MKTSPPLDLETLDSHAYRALNWVLASIEVTGRKGSAAYYQLWKGWSEAYPETTGYLIETLFDAARQLDLPPMKMVAFECADWLCSIQLPSGAFPGGIGEKSSPIVFDTAMIVFGLRRAWEETKHKKYWLALTHAVSWLEKQQDEDGIWRSHAFVPGYFPSYYTMVVWSLLKANKYLKNKALQQKLTLSLDGFCQKITSDLTVRDWSFRPGEPAFTHTIAYTLQGMLEAGLLLKKHEAVAQVQAIAQKLLSLRRQNGKLAGSYDEQWKGDYSFKCLTGQAQTSLLFFRLHEVTGEALFLKEGRFLLWQMLRYQNIFGAKHWRGSIPGSAPMWGKYQRFRFPNWAAKFFLDALLAARKMEIASAGR